MKWLNWVTWSDPAISDTIRVPQVDLCLIREDYTLPIVYRPVLMLFSPVETSLLVFPAEERFFDFFLGLKSDLSEVP